MNLTITDAENKENTVAGAHNVGGIVGYLTAENGGESVVSSVTNNGGDITATGARNASGTGFIQEQVREYTDYNDEKYNVGNIGGIVGYMYDEASATSVRVENASNRGTVHSAYFDGMVPETAEAANVGGIVGKLDSGVTGTEELLEAIANGTAQAAVSDVRNMGDVQGYTGVGGVIGMMYNGSVADSFNVGTVNTTRTAQSISTDPLNMGGVVGDTTAGTDAMAIIYNVYNAGQVGDATFTYYGRHVGGVVGRLSGFLANSYNTGDIYNGYSTVGGLVGYWLSGDITNVFNTGNITVVNYDTQNGTTQVGGLIGAYGNGSRDDTLSNAYNLGTIRAFAAYDSDGGAETELSVGGIIGNVRKEGLTIENVYTTNNIYGAIGSSPDTWTKSSSGVGQIVGIYNNGTLEGQTTIKNAYFVDIYNANSNGTDHTTFSEARNRDATTVTDFDDLKQYDGFDDGEWRIYEGTTPILNAFMPSMKGNESSWNTAGWDVQYGTAYNPFLTIIEANGDDVVLDWGAGLLDREEGLAVYGGSLTINNMTSASLWGTIYAEGALTISGTSDSDIHLGASANLYGESVTIAAGSGIEMHGTIISTDGDVNIDAEGDAEIIGVITSSEAGSSTTVSGIGKTFDADNMDFGDLRDYKSATASVGSAYGTTTSEAAANGDVSIAAGGRADVLYGNLGTGSITAHGDLSVSGEESVYIDSLLSINGDLHLESTGEMLIDLTNMGDVGTLHDGFLTHFTQEGASNSTIHVNGDADNFKIMVDLWNEETGSFDLGKYDTTHSLADDLDALQVDFGDSSTAAARDYTYIWVSTGEQLAAIEGAASGNSDIYDYNFALKDNINASDIKDYTAIGSGTAYTGTFDGRGYNVIGLDVDTTGNAGLFDTVGEGGVVKDLGIYSSGFTGTGSAGAVAAVNKGTISNVTGFGNTVQGGSGSVGGLVGENFGMVENGANTGTVIADSEEVAVGGLVGTNKAGGVISSGYSDSAVNATAGTSAGLGGVVGANAGTVESVDSLGVTHGSGSTYVGGIAGTNTGKISSAYNESIVTGKTHVGGIAGSNGGTIENVVNAASVTGDENSEYIGGLVGTNSGSITDGRNNGVITGTTYVGGLVGANTKGGTLKNLTNDSSAAITGDTYVGGIAGSNAGLITAEDGNELINRGTITGHTYVGGVAGVNEEGGTIENVNNDVDLHVNTDVPGDAQFFGGVAGQNSGTITKATNRADLNAADASYVGGIVGHNTSSGILTGTIANEGAVSGGSAVAGVIGENDNADLLNNTSGEDLIIQNAGTVTATTGGAAGIIYTHSGAVNNVTLINSGTVTGHSLGTGSSGNESYTGGIFGIITGDITDSRLENQGTIEDDTGTVSGLGDATGGIAGKNTGTITDSVLVNTGTVSGAGNTGGIFGENEGTISTSSLINTGAVTGTDDNTGGLIGTNSGDITGGSNGEWYEYQIYNNGAVTGTTNVGGLVGENKADLTAGYNTGTVKGSQNVGGIAGTSSDGTIDQVFNTGSVGTNTSSVVGGLVGSLTGGILTNGYSTTAAQGSTNVGNLVGTISGGTASGLINAAESGRAVGSGTLSGSYSFSSADNGTTGITYLTGDDKKDADKYGDLDFGEEGAWKIYDGSSMPILEAFLTKLTVNEYGTGDYANVTLDEFLGDLIYNAKDQDISITDLIKAGYITGSDEMYDPLTGKEVNALDAYRGSADKGGDNGGRGLIFNTDGQVHAGSYSDWLASAQFAEGENGLLMGYDITLTAEIGAYTLHVSLEDLWRIYGSALINGNANIDYEDLFHYLAEDMTDEMKVELGYGLTFEQTIDGSLDDTNGRTTQDVGNYTWGGTVSLDGAVITIGDYVLSFTDGSSTTTSTEGSLDLTAHAEVKKADLTIDLSDVDRTYGEAALPNDTRYDASFKEDQVVNGDTLTIDLDILAELVQDGAIYQDETGKWRTRDVIENGYTWTVNTEDIVAALNSTTFNSDNYNITVNAGKSTVYARELTLGDILASIVYGNQDEAGLQIESGLDLSGVVYDDDVKLGSGYSYSATGDYESNRGGRNTADVGIYENSLSLSDLTLTGTKAGNYTLVSEALGTIRVDKASLTITIGSAETTYGTAFDENDYGYNLGGVVNGDTDAALKGTIDGASGGYVNTGAADGTNGRVTADAGEYSLGFGNKLVGENILQNYNITTVSKGKVTVNKADLTIQIGNADTTYGTAFDENSYDYTLGGVANGDSVADLKETIDGASGGYKNTGAADGTNGRVTADAGEYTLVFENNLVSVDVLKNYNITTVSEGKVTVNKADLTIGADSVETVLGSVPDYSGTDVNGALVNGDTLGNYGYGVYDSAIEQVLGVHERVIGLWIDGVFYGLSGSDDWTSAAAFFKNYRITATPGTLTVIENTPDYQWNGIYHEAPFDRMRNFRERKAEIHFIAGGMTV